MKPVICTPDEELATEVHCTRIIRFALEVMWSAVDYLPDEVTVDPGVQPALRAISDWLEKAEEGMLRVTVLKRNYAVIRPVSLANPSISISTGQVPSGRSIKE